jgi:radical SAM protein with 4Fe4S-binding SPASM domain
VGEKVKLISKVKPMLSNRDAILIKRILAYGGKVDDSCLEPVNNCNIWDFRYLMISWNGDVSPCNLDVNMDLRLGNVYESSIHDLYTGDVAKKLREKTGCGKSLVPCEKCFDGNNWSFNERIDANDL